MEVIKKEITFLKSNYNASTAKHCKLEVRDDLVLLYQKVRFSDSSSVIKVTGKNVRVEFGCRNADITTLQRALNFLKTGKYEEVTETRFVKKGSIRKLADEIIEESDNYFITDNGKAFSKDEHEFIEHTYTPKVVEIKYGNELYYQDNYVCNIGGKRKESAIEKLEYLIDTITGLKNKLNETT